MFPQCRVNGDRPAGCLRAAGQLIQTYSQTFFVEIKGGRHRESTSGSSFRFFRLIKLTIPHQYAAMPAGIIRGVLSRAGLSSTVSPEITSMSQCEYTHFLR
jgi:hypothetical protein